MNFFEIVKNRTSYRGKFENSPVPKEDLIQIMKAGYDAPSGCNMQTTSFIAIDDPQLMSQLLGLVNPPIAKTAKAAIVVLTERVFAYRDKCFATQDYSAAIQSMLLAAVALGYQSCWYEGHITDDDDIGRKMADVMGVPQNLDLVCFLPIGKGVDEPKRAKKKPFEERAWFNGYKK